MKGIASIAVAVASICVGQISHATAVLGAPYCADRVTLMTFPGPDGTARIQTSHGGKSCRDSDGRTRTETLIGATASATSATVLHTIEITDPVGGVRYVLDVPRKEAQRFSFGVLLRMRPSGQPPHLFSARDDPSGRWTRSEDLGSKVIEGLTAYGQRNIFQIGPADDTNPISRTIEIWVIPDLDLMVDFRTAQASPEDSRIQLINIKRGDPDPLLFKVPAEYRIVDK